MVLRGLADAAAAAAEDGRPLPLHTLRVLGPGPDLDIIRQLLLGPPRLRCLQLDMSAAAPSSEAKQQLQGAVLHALAPLKATQLHDLYFKGPPWNSNCTHGVAELLPVSLERLSWVPGDAMESVPDLSHLAQLGSLQLERWYGQSSSFSSRLPRGLQNLELMNAITPLSELQQEREILSRYEWVPTGNNGIPELASFINIRRLLCVDVAMLGYPNLCVPLEQLVSNLSALRVYAYKQFMQPGYISVTRSLQGLRSLHIDLYGLTVRPGLAAHTQLTRLVMVTSDNRDDHQQQQAWVAEVGSMTGLRWLSVPDMLLSANQTWLGGLTQLQVLVVRGVQPILDTQPPPQVLPQVVEWLEGCSPQALPPRLLLLGVYGMLGRDGMSWQLWHRLQQRLGSSGCEVVLGMDLDEVADPTQRLAGLPEALQHALA